MPRARGRARSSPAPSTEVIPAAVTQYWDTQFDAGSTVFDDGAFRLSVDPSLAPDRRVMVLVVGALTRAVVSPDIAAAVGAVASEGDFRSRLEGAGIQLNGADCLHYLTSPVSADDQSVRRLTADDAELFARFETATSEQDRDDAFVELDHWAVFGAVVDGELVSAASAYPWGAAPLADMGVLTIDRARGAGHGRRVIQALSAFALAEGLEPQYRCQLDNAASIALAERAGFELYGTWDVVAPE